MQLPGSPRCVRSAKPVFMASTSLWLAMPGLKEYGRA